MVRRRPSMGRQKIQIGRIESKECQVCFSKRRARLFNKADELAILGGMEMADVVFSPAFKAFSFGNPSFEAIRERFAPTGAAAGGGAGGAGAGEDNNQLEADARNMAEGNLMEFAIAVLQEVRAAFAAGRNNANNNNVEMDMKMQPMMAMAPAMAPQQGFATSGMEMKPQEGLGSFPGPN